MIEFSFNEDILHTAEQLMEENERMESAGRVMEGILETARKTEQDSEGRIPQMAGKYIYDGIRKKYMLVRNQKTAYCREGAWLVCEVLSVSDDAGEYIFTVSPEQWSAPLDEVIGGFESGEIYEVDRITYVRKMTNAFDTVRESLERELSDTMDRYRRDCLGRLSAIELEIDSKAGCMNQGCDGDTCQE